jgi:hypothetical protein
MAVDDERGSETDMVEGKARGIKDLMLVRGFVGRDGKKASEAVLS